MLTLKNIFFALFRPKNEGTSNLMKIGAVAKSNYAE